jgi:uncharacterized glyoxalase superfamily protein PhnB
MPHDSQEAMIITSLRYRDAPAAIEYLCEKFGFAKRLVIPGPDGTIRHAQLTLGAGMIMLGSAQNRDFGPLVKTPQEVGANTQSAYVVVQGIDAHYQRAKAAGAEIAMEIEDTNYGGRLYFALDPEGTLWHFGSYDPWAESS